MPMLIWGLDRFIVQIEEHDHFVLLPLMKKTQMWKNENAMKRDEEKINEGKC
jgi:hypothetical protein